VLILKHNNNIELSQIVLLIKVFFEIVLKSSIKTVEPTHPLFFLPHQALFQFMRKSFKTYLNVKQFKILKTIKLIKYTLEL